MFKNSVLTKLIKSESKNPAGIIFIERWIKSERTALIVLLTLAALTWVPRINGPIDLRWDGGVYYILGTSLAEGKGYKLLNEPGEIDAVQYPPLLPLIIAGHQLILQTSDPTTVGRWLRLSAFLTFMVYICAVFRLIKKYFSWHYAFFATLLCLFSLHVYFLSDLCFPEILFSLSTILFVLCNSKEKNRPFSIAAYFFAVASYALRTVGVAVLIVWVLESLIKRRLKQAIFRLALVLIPIACWQYYIFTVESSYEYNHPAYSYQRDAYMFYNVSYSRNISLEDPFTPEKGKARVVPRIVNNVIQLPGKIGESLINSYWMDELLRPIGGIVESVITRLSVVFRYLIGLAILVGLLLLLFQYQRVIFLYLCFYLSAICSTPFLEQFTRYLMPVMPFLVLSLIVFLTTVKNLVPPVISSKLSVIHRNFVVGSILIVLFLQLVTFKHVYFSRLEPIVYTDRNNNLLKYRMFFENRSFQDFNRCVQFIRQNAHANDVVSAGTPQWIYLQTGLKAVMPPFEKNTALAFQKLDNVPVKYLIVGKDVIGSEKYIFPVVEHYTEQWKQVFITPESDWTVYKRTNR